MGKRLAADIPTVRVERAWRQGDTVSRSWHAGAIDGETWAFETGRDEVTARVTPDSVVAKSYAGLGHRDFVAVGFHAGTQTPGDVVPTEVVGFLSMAQARDLRNQLDSAIADREWSM